MPLHFLKNLDTIKELIEWHGLAGDLSGSRLEEVYKLVCDMIQELGGKPCEKSEDADER